MILKVKQKKKDKKKNLYENPAQVIILSFMMLVIIGMLLLMLPISSRQGTFTSPLEALFTATSAVCVTGLIVYDTYSHFSDFGHLVILFLIQVGGIGLLTFTTFFNIALRKKIGLKGIHVAKESISSDNVANVIHLLKTILLVTLVIETIGAAILCMVFVPDFGLYGITISIFTSVSAFCNAGFDILGIIAPGCGIAPYYNNPIVLFTIMGLIICGGLGFIVWYDLYRFKNTRHLSFHTKVVLFMTATLIIVGTILFAILEWENRKTIGPMHTDQKIVNSLFQSVTFRTAGFNTVNIGEMFGSTKVMAILLMFIGAAPGSTGGGVKVTTIVVIIATILSVYKNHPNTVLLRRKISKANVYKALAIFFTAGLVVAITTSVICLTIPNQVVSEINALFEAVSAFGTVGVTAGVTSVSSTPALIALIITMFLGRVGPVSLALMLAYRTQRDDSNTVIPDAKIIVG